MKNKKLLDDNDYTFIIDGTETIVQCVDGVFVDQDAEMISLIFYHYQPTTCGFHETSEDTKDILKCTCELRMTPRTLFEILDEIYQMINERDGKNQLHHNKQGENGNVVIKEKKNGQ